MTTNSSDSLYGARANSCSHLEKRLYRLLVFLGLTLKIRDKIEAGSVCHGLTLIDAAIALDFRHGASTAWAATSLLSTESPSAQGGGGGGAQLLMTDQTSEAARWIPLGLDIMWREGSFQFYHASPSLPGIEAFRQLQVSLTITHNYLLTVVSIHSSIHAMSKPIVIYGRTSNPSLHMAGSVVL